MSVGPDRVPPQDPSGITLTYGHRDHWNSWLYDNLESWHVSADIISPGPRGDAHVGEMEILAVDLFVTLDPADLLGRHGGELSRIAQALFDPASDELYPELGRHVQLESSRMLILHWVNLEPQWRGFGFGALLAGLAIRKLAGGAWAAVCYPAPLGWPAAPPPPGVRDAEWDQAAGVLCRVAAKLGFEHYRDGVHVLNFSQTDFDEQLAEVFKGVRRYLPGWD